MSVPFGTERTCFGVWLDIRGPGQKAGVGDDEPRSGRANHDS
jgi:hypothetical protein